MPLPTLQQFNAPSPQPATMRLQAMEFGDKQKRTGLYERQVATGEETLNFNKMKSQLETGLRFIPTLEQGEYPKFKEWIGSINPDIIKFMPDEAVVAKKSPEDWDKLKNKFVYDADNLTKINIEQYKATIKEAEEEEKRKAATALQTQKDAAAMDRVKETARLKTDEDKIVNTPTPGVFFNKSEKKFYKNDESGNPVEMTSAEVLRENLKYKEDIPTNDIRVMRQSVPSVKQLIGQARAALKGTMTGPLKGRWKDLWSTKVGASDPNFRKLKTDVNLLVTRLMKMHVGARGGQYIMEHFEKIINAGKDTPENLMAALDEIEMYANEVSQSHVDNKQETGRTVSERRTTPDGKTIVKYSDGTFGYE